MVLLSVLKLILELVMIRLIKDRFLACYEKCMEQHESAVDVFTVEDVDCAIRSLKNDKVAGPDGLILEHLLFAGGRLSKLLYQAVK